MRDYRKERKTFGNVSELYEKARIGYPQSIIDDIVTFSNINKNSSILDIGCGSGQLTLPFAKQGCSIVGLDISQDMINIAKKKCMSFLNATFKKGSFENIKLTQNYFNLIVSGMAWHWVTPKGRYEKASSLLKSKGTIALCWSYQHAPTSKFLQEVGKILDMYGEKNVGPLIPKVLIHAKSAYEELGKSLLFSSTQQKEYEEELEFSKEKYLNLIMTYGWVQLLSEEERKNLAKDLTQLYERYNEPLIVPYRWILVMAKKKV